MADLENAKSRTPLAPLDIIAGGPSDAGVVLIEATKQIYARPKGRVVRGRQLLPIPRRQQPAMSVAGGSRRIANGFQRRKEK